MRQFTFILFYLLWHAHDGSVLAAFICMHFLYPTGSLATFSPNNNKISGYNTSHTRLIKSSQLEKTTYVHASAISFHLFTCELHTPSCYRLRRQLQMHIGFQIGTPSKYTNNRLPHDLDYIGFTKIRCQCRLPSFGVWRVYASKLRKSNGSICSITSWTGDFVFSDVAIS